METVHKLIITVTKDIRTKKKDVWCVEVRIEPAAGFLIGHNVLWYSKFPSEMDARKVAFELSRHVELEISNGN